MSELWAMYGDMLINAILVHIFYVVVSVAAGFAIGIISGVLLTGIPQYSDVVLPLISIFQTVPGLVFMGILFLLIGMTPWTVIIALTVYAMFPIMKNTYTGILAVDRKYVEAAEGCGMTPMQTLLKVKIPLAMPTIIAGLRMSAIYTISWAVLAAMIGLGGLGDFIYQGTSSNNNVLIMLGAVPAAVLAVVIGELIDLLQKKLTPRGMRKGVS